MLSQTGNQMTIKQRNESICTKRHGKSVSTQNTVHRKGDKIKSRFCPHLSPILKVNDTVVTAPDEVPGTFARFYTKKETNLYNKIRESGHCSLERRAVKTTTF